MLKSYGKHLKLCPFPEAIVPKADMHREWWKDDHCFVHLYVIYYVIEHFLSLFMLCFSCLLQLLLMCLIPWHQLQGRNVFSVGFFLKTVQCRLKNFSSPWMDGLKLKIYMWVTNIIVQMSQTQKRKFIIRDCSGSINLPHVDCVMNHPVSPQGLLLLSFAS